MLELAVSRFFDLSGKNQSYQVYLSMFDVNLETVRDFGKYFFAPNG